MKGGAEDHDLKVKVEGCDNYKLTVSVDGEASTADSSLGVATIRDLDIPATKAGAELVIKLTADGMNEYRKSLTIKRNDSSANVTVTAKLATTEAAIAVENDQKYETEMESVNVEVVSAVDIATVKIAGEDATLDGTKKASKLIRVGEVGASVEVNVELTFKYHKAFTTKFKLARVAAGQRPIAPVKVTLYSGENYGTAHELTLKDGAYTCDALDDIEYSVVKLVMEMNGTPTKAEITKCHDERQPDYASQPKKDQIGVFSGRLKAEIDGKEKRTDFVPVNGTTYTEYLIVGKGEVGYDFSFEATGRQNTECKVKITNKSNNEYENEQWGNLIDPERFIGGVGNANVFFWQGYRKEFPKKDDSDIAKMEYMGNEVAFLVYKRVSDKDQTKNDLFVYYNISDDIKGEEIHNFVRIQKSKISKLNDGTPVNLLSLRFNPEGKYVDAFIASKKKLPIALHPVFLQNKWDKIVKQGFRLQLQNDLLFHADGENKGQATELYDDFLNCVSLRKTTKIYQRNNENNHTSSHPIKLGKKQEYTALDGNTTKQINDKVFLQPGKDTFILIPVSKETESDKLNKWFTKIVYKIQKSNNRTCTESTFVDEVGQSNLEYPVDKWGFVELGVSSNSFKHDGKIDSSKVYKFVDGEVYRIQVDATLKEDNSHEYYDYQICYTDENQTMDNYEADGESSGELFGVPFGMEAIEASQFSAIREELAREAIFAR